MASHPASFRIDAGTPSTRRTGRNEDERSQRWGTHDDVAAVLEGPADVNVASHGRKR